jgi:hypothetical protein
MSNDSQDSFKGTTGKKNEFKVSNEYPYIMFAPVEYEFNSEDTFILSSSDNSYTEKVKYSDVEKNEGVLILWFPMPPKGKKYSLKINFYQISGDDPVKEYLVFEDEVLTLRDEETAIGEQQLIRGKN